jgi:hypothetical protein
VLSWDFREQVLAVDWENVAQNVGVHVEMPVWKVVTANIYYCSNHMKEESGSLRTDASNLS